MTSRYLANSLTLRIRGHFWLGFSRTIQRIVKIALDLKLKALDSSHVWGVPSRLDHVDQLFLVNWE